MVGKPIEQFIFGGFFFEFLLFDYLGRRRGHLYRVLRPFPPLLLPRLLHLQSDLDRRGRVVAVAVAEISLKGTFKKPCAKLECAR